MAGNAKTPGAASAFWRPRGLMRSIWRSPIDYLATLLDFGAGLGSGVLCFEVNFGCGLGSGMTCFWLGLLAFLLCLEAFLFAVPLTEVFVVPLTVLLASAAQHEPRLRPHT